MAAGKSGSPSRLLRTFLVSDWGWHTRSPGPACVPLVSALPPVRLTHSLCSLTAPIAPLGSHSGHLIGALDAQSTLQGTVAKPGIKQSSMGLFCAGHLRRFHRLMCFAQLSRTYLPP